MVIYSNFYYSDSLHLTDSELMVKLHLSQWDALWYCIKYYISNVSQVTWGVS